MLHTSINLTSGVARGRTPSRSALAEATERGAYTTLLTVAGFVIVNLLRVAERRDARLERRGR